MSLLGFRTSRMFSESIECLRKITLYFQARSPSEVSGKLMTSSAISEKLLTTTLHSISYLLDSIPSMFLSSFRASPSKALKMMFPLLMYVVTSRKPVRSKLSLSELMRIMFLPPTLTPRRRATNMLAEDFNSLRIVIDVRAGEHERARMRAVLSASPLQHVVESCVIGKFLQRRSQQARQPSRALICRLPPPRTGWARPWRSEEHTSEL